MMRAIELPVILDQKNTPACAAYSLAGLANYYLKQKGIDDQIDPVKLYESNERAKNLGVRTLKLLEYGKTIGLPSIKNKRYFIKEFFYVPKIMSIIEQKLIERGGLLIGYDLYDKDNFQKRLDATATLARRPLTVHGMVLVGYDNETKKFKLANSWGEKFGEKGYLYIPYVLMTEKYISDLYGFSLA